MSVAEIALGVASGIIVVMIANENRYRRIIYAAFFWSLMIQVAMDLAERFLN